MIGEFKGDNAWLSNFYPAIVVWHNYPFHTVENAYQASKLRCPTIEELRAIDFMRPGAAKQKMRGVARRSNHLSIMRQLLVQKFSWPELRDKLIATGTERLIEGNYWGDTYWGVSAKSGQGDNHLGRLLMAVRSELAAPVSTIEQGAGDPTIE